MRWLSRVWQKSLTEKKLDSELQFHIEQRIAEHVASGMAPDEAQRQAKVEFGGVELYKEECRESRWENQLEIMARDLRLAFRTLRKEKRFTIIAVLALALGIGSSTAMFSVVYNGLISPFAYRDADRLVTVSIRDTDQSQDNGRSSLSYSELQDFKKLNHVFDQVIANSEDDIVYETGRNNLRFAANYVTPGSFETLGIPPFLGRSLEAYDYDPAAPPVFVMRYKTWMTQFAGDRSLIGKPFVLNGTNRILVGVAGPRFAWGGIDFWIPEVPGIQKTRNAAGAETYWGLLGHLREDVSLAQAEADLNVLAQSLSKKYAKDYPQHFHAEVDTLSHAVVGRNFRKTVYTLFAAVGLLLLIGCANVANLLLARSTIRGREFAVRTALGASRSRLVRQLLAESFILAITSAFIGLLFAWIGVKLLAEGMPQFTVPSETVIELNPYVLVFAILVGALTTVIFGLFPALQAAKAQPQDALRDGGKGLGGTNTKSRLRHTVVIVEVAMSVILLFTAGLFTRGYFKLQSVQLGFDPTNVLSTRIPLPEDMFKTPEQITNFYRPLMEQLRATPGIESVSVTTGIPPYGGIETNVLIPGKDHRDKWLAIFQLASEDFFAVMRIPMISGRTFTSEEVNNKRKVAVINRKFQQTYFADQDPIGRTVVLDELKQFSQPVEDPTFQIVGVVEDSQNYSLENPIAPEAWVPYNVTGAASRGLLIRTNGSSYGMRQAIYHASWATDSRVAMVDLYSVDYFLELFTYAVPRFSFYIVSTFALIGLVLVIIGVYSVIAYNTAQRTHEIGIRVALGAAQGDVLSLILRQGFAVLVAGIVIGMAVSFAIAKLVTSLIWGVKPYDPMTAGFVVGLILVIGLLACWFPARRATRVDPMAALRYE